MVRVPMSRAKAGLCAWVRSVARGGEIVVLTVRGRDAVALVPLSTVRLIQQVGRILPDVSEATEGLPDVSCGADAMLDPQGGR